MNIQSPEVISLLRGTESIEVDDGGYVVDWPYLEGIVDLFCVSVGLPTSFGAPLGRFLLNRCGRRTHTLIPEDQRVLVCRVFEEGHGNTVAEFTTSEGPVCAAHVQWRQPPAVCTCNETPHIVGCPAWDLSDLPLLSQ